MHRDEASGATSQAKDFIMACQPIFSRNMDVFAHELLFRQCSDDECAIISDFDSATNQIIADGFSLASQRLGPKCRVSVNVGYDNIMSRYVLALPADRVLLEISADASATDELLGAMGELREDGYRFVVDNYNPESPHAHAFLALAEYVKVPIDDRPGSAVARVKKSLAGWGGKAVATRVETWEAYEGCRSLGFDFFQGFYFSYPKELVGKKISSHKFARLNLLRLLSDEEARLSNIVDAIAADQALTVRLLHFVNSAAFSMADRVDSLGRAASLVGSNTLRKWALAAVLSDIDSSATGVELSYRAMHGAMFLGMLGEKHAQDGHGREALYLLGLLNNVDALMGMKMKEIVDGMPLMAVVKHALVRDVKEPLTRFLNLLDAIWRNDWEQAQGFLRAVGVPLPTAATLYMQAGRDASALMASFSKA